MELGDRPPIDRMAHRQLLDGLAQTRHREGLRRTPDSMCERTGLITRCGIISSTSAIGARAFAIGTHTSAKSKESMTTRSGRPAGDAAHGGFSPGIQRTAARLPGRFGRRRRTGGHTPCPSGDGSRRRAHLQTQARRSAGLPDTKACGATSRVTNVPAATRANSPMVTPARTTAPAPTVAPRPTRVGVSQDDSSSYRDPVTPKRAERG